MHEATTPPVDHRPTIFLLDDDTQSALKGNLRGPGFRVPVAVEIEDALDWMSK